MWYEGRKLGVAWPGSACKGRDVVSLGPEWEQRQREWAWNKTQIYFNLIDHILHLPYSFIVQADLLECEVKFFSVFCNASGALLLKFPSKSNSNNQAKGSQWFSNSYCKQHSLQTDCENHGLN